MMTDRELLEWAAKAAGVTVLSGEVDQNVRRNVKECAGLLTDRWACWSPLTDDGDALRLSSVLCMNIRHEDPNAVICGWTELQRTPITHDRRGPWFWKEWLRAHGNDRDAATRRAIVRAAAAIGQQIDGTSKPA